MVIYFLCFHFCGFNSTLRTIILCSSFAVLPIFFLVSFVRLFYYIYFCYFFYFPLFFVFAASLYIIYTVVLLNICGLLTYCLSHLPVLLIITLAAKLYCSLHLSLLLLHHDSSLLLYYCVVTVL